MISDEYNSPLYENSLSDYELYQILEENGYKTNETNLRILKEGIESGKYQLDEGLGGAIRSFVGSGFKPRSFRDGWKTNFRNAKLLNDTRRDIKADERQKKRDAQRQAAENIANDYRKKAGLEEPVSKAAPATPAPTPQHATSQAAPSTPDKIVHTPTSSATASWSSPSPKSEVKKKASSTPGKIGTYYTVNGSSATTSWSSPLKKEAPATPAPTPKHAIKKEATPTPVAQKPKRQLTTAQRDQAVLRTLSSKNRDWTDEKIKAHNDSGKGSFYYSRDDQGKVRAHRRDPSYVGGRDTSYKGTKKTLDSRTAADTAAKEKAPITEAVVNAFNYLTENYNEFNAFDVYNLAKSMMTSSLLESYIDEETGENILENDIYDLAIEIFTLNEDAKFSDYDLYQILEENGYKTTEDNLQILKEGLESGKYEIE